MDVNEYRKLRDGGQVSKKGRIVVDDKTFKNIDKKESVGVSPAPKVSAPKTENLAQEGPKTNKYGAKPVADPDGGNKFPSTFEFNNATELRNMLRAGLIMSVARQALVLLPAGITWQIDFLVEHLDGTTEYIEAKGKDMADFLMKEKLFRDLYPHKKLTIQRKRSRKKK